MLVRVGFRSVAAMLPDPVQYGSFSYPNAPRVTVQVTREVHRAGRLAQVRPLPDHSGSRCELLAVGQHLVAGEVRVLGVVDRAQVGL